MLKMPIVAVCLAALLCGCQSLPFSHSAGGQPQASTTERQALWQRLRHQQADSLATQPRSAGCSHHRCNHSLDCQ
ncbi:MULTISPECIES: hypothetical protein [Ferrimonas]|uniref:hypothetical protein n=1 Tax=Ferrimonas TaxID=44011 RepID=UPI0003FE31BA|nr:MULTISPECIES: hypothetical protein [Ferrimonas]USD38075.1 hypothetical protein J8Z22_02610 [Ferrimonas sp. SCSIO 43195]